MIENEHNRTQAQIANDGSDAPRPENVHGAGTQQQGQAPLNASKPDEASGNDGDQLVGDAKGSSHRGDEPNAESNNTGGGSDAEQKNQTKNTTAYNSEYSNARSAPSSANDGGKIGDADNPA